MHDMRKENQNKSVHAMATSIVFSRVPSPQSLPNALPQQDLRKCNPRQVVNLSSDENDTIRKRYHVIVQNMLFQQFPAFESFKPSTPSTTHCQYAENMPEKSVTVTMPVLMKDEKKYAECVDVLDQLEQWTHDIYSVIPALILIHPYHLPSHLLPDQTNQLPTFHLHHLMMTL